MKTSVTTINKHIFSHFPIDYNGAIWEKLTRLDFSKQTPLPKDILCFLEKGTIRKYYLDTETELSREFSVDFYFSGDIFTAKADNTIEAMFTYEPISKGTLWYLDMAEVRKMFFESQLCSATQKVFMEERFREKAIREIQLLKASPLDLYNFLLQHKPKYIQSVPLKYLASYIGITPQALSRIRKRIN